MKNILIFSAVLVFISCDLLKGQIQLVGGSLDFLTGPGRKVIKIEYYYKGLKIRDLTEDEYIIKIAKAKNEKETGSGDQWKENWNKAKTNSYEPAFEEAFNAYITQGIVAKRNIDSAVYIMQVNTSYIDPGYNVYVQSDPGSVNYSIVFKEITNPDSPLAVLSIKGMSCRTANVDPDIRISDNYTECGKRVALFLKKKCKLK
jgi:hypothetical protein